MPAALMSEFVNIVLLQFTSTCCFPLVLCILPSSSPFSCRSDHRTHISFSLLSGVKTGIIASELPSTRPCDGQPTAFPYFPASKLAGNYARRSRETQRPNAPVFDRRQRDFFTRVQPTILLGHRVALSFSRKQLDGSFYTPAFLWGLNFYA